MQENKSKTWLDLVREVFPDVSDEAADSILWEHTGFPAFWTGDPEECCRRQLEEYKLKLEQGKDPYS